ncbi:acyl-CoA thioesterase [Rothia nasimurium]|uniref:acyl-CoA thioesterase n=1 Tax=Rothia nasimurium TaxID=85336 RepID=UPI001F15CB6F|nr:acyl-CoA thioesterase II [Rothia nasimurium]
MSHETLESLSPTQKLLAMLNLAPGGASAHEHVFSALTLTKESPRIFGGQVLAQAIMAAAHTVEGKTLHSLHGYFLRPGDVEGDLSYGAEALNDARSFSTRWVQAYQGGQPIFSCITSFQVPAQGPDHSSAMPENIPDPESLPTAADLLGHLQVPIAQKVAFSRPFDVRHITAPLYVTPGEEKRPTNMVWFKTFEALPDDPVLHQAALAYASDYTQLEPVLRQHGKTWLEPGMKVASLDHAMWFHRPARADNWLLLVQEAPSAQDARGLSVGKIFTRDGVHVATVTQEAMIRLPEYREQ